MLVDVLADVVGDDEVLVRVPAQALLRGADVLLAQRLAVHVGGPHLGRGPADDGADADERRALRLLHPGVDGPLELGQLVGVADLDDLPAVGLEALRDVVGVRPLGRSVERDRVVVVDVDDLAQPEVAGQRGGLVGDALHEVAVGADRERVVVHDLRAVALAQEALRHRHPDAVGEALPERAGRDLDAGRHVDLVALGVARGQRPPLAEALELVQRQVVAREVQRGVEEHGPVAGAEHEAIAVRPLGVGGVVLHDPREEQVRGRGHRQRQAGVTAVGGLHRVHREGADRVDRALVDVGGGHAPVLSRSPHRRNSSGDPRVTRLPRAGAGMPPLDAPPGRADWRR